MDDPDKFDELDDSVAALERRLGDTTQVAQSFEGQLGRTQDAMVATVRDLGNLERGFSGGLRRAFDGVIFDGMKLTDALSVVAKSMADTVYASAINPVTRHLGGLLADGVNAAVSGMMPYADGAPFSQGKVMPFARGGVVSGPTTFPMRGGVGLMGEAGPEAIMPLARGADGRLGVRTADGGRSVHVTINVSTPDAQSFQRSQGQIAARMSQALGRGQRNR